MRQKEVRVEKQVPFMKPPDPIYLEAGLISDLHLYGQTPPQF